ncbi:MAG: PLP-dependent transferase [Planctomycetota bacterium]
MNRHTRLLAIDRGSDPYAATVPPLYQTATFHQPGAEVAGPYDYSRSGNPTRAALESKLAELEGGARGLAFSSGLAALRTLLSALPERPRVVATADLYGGSCRLLGEWATNRGLELELATDAAALARALRRPADLVLVETPGNPGLGIVDLADAARRARDAGALLCVDGSLMTPWLQNPLAAGASVVLHSATKGLGGHGDVVAGALITADEALGERLAFLQNAEGSALAPFEAWLLARGLKTLGVRVERQQAGASALARALASVLGADAVLYPGLTGHPGRACHAAQARGPGTVLSLRLGDRRRAAAFVDALELFAITVSFGSVESSVSLPVSMSHASVPVALRAASRPPDDLVRISVGLEDPRDLAEDCRRALEISGARAGAGSRP